MATAPAQKMKCPKCQCEMLEGDAAVHTWTLGWLFNGFCSWQWLWFYPEGEKRKATKILCTGQRTPAYECPQCGAVFVEKG